MLMVVAQDGNNNIFPVAFTIVEGETVAGWSFFLRNLQEYVASQPDLCLISDRHASIESAYNNPANDWHWQHPTSTHVYCIRHIAHNFVREIKDRHLRKTLVNAGYALTQPTIQHYRSEIVLSNPDAGSWIDSLAREKWTRAYHNGERWGHMTTNLVESMNGVFKGIRNLLITALVEAPYFRMASLFSTRGQRWSAVRESGQLFSESCMNFLKEQSTKANSHHVTAFDRFNRTFSVRETIDHNEGLPCQQYKTNTLLEVYNVTFPVIAKEDYWLEYDGEVVWKNDMMRRKKKGRPNSTCIRTEMDVRDKMERKCSICR
ncbi:uncharacterized protein LOC131649736 [Vicia villosa]|uniref:uncharacterized protein LOC131649736 n=1 Tax=Vicia villosa TaxID=3911 RepID=UPI00273B4CCC|nr:uncharacterized protein LOC131649736 [Vicia villosa]